jgi:hypothetical protein
MKMKNYFKTLKESIYSNKIIVASFYLMLSIVAIYTFNTPIEKVLATYITLDIIAMFVMVGILSYYKTNYSKRDYKKRTIFLPEGFKYLIILGLIYSMMFYASNYENHSIVGHVLNITVILILGLGFIFKLNSYRKIYMPLIKKSYINDNEFKSLYLFDSCTDLYFEYSYTYGNEFELTSLEKKGIIVEKDHINMGGVKYSKRQYLNYLKENEIKTLEDLTEEDKLLIAMINIH